MLFPLIAKGTVLTEDPYPSSSVGPPRADGLPTDYCQAHAARGLVRACALPAPQLAPWAPARPVELAAEMRNQCHARH
ncbi:hypothetical protein ACQPWY_14080 [Pseudonocardia xinjiangensis]|uniref:hypothetical protein n=1 Tax=Pseudonocardia xinjiangensis TaxID=75289 RepID=UPI003D8C5DCF